MCMRLRLSASMLETGGETFAPDHPCGLMRMGVPLLLMVHNKQLARGHSLRPPQQLRYLEASAHHSQSLHS
jgi:hypothetical protein